MTADEIAVRMQERSSGTSSISPWASLYYMVKVSLACVVAYTRKPAIKEE